jgi:hypothetical protein
MNTANMMLVVDESRAMFCSSLIYTYILGRYSYCVLIQSKGFETKSLPRWCIWRLCGACMILKRKSNMGDCWYVRCSWILEKAGRPQPASSSIYSTSSCSSIPQLVDASVHHSISELNGKKGKLLVRRLYRGIYAEQSRLAFVGIAWYIHIPKLACLTVDNNKLNQVGCITKTKF